MYLNLPLKLPFYLVIVQLNFVMLQISLYTHFNIIISYILHSLINRSERFFFSFIFEPNCVGDHFLVKTNIIVLQSSSNYQSFFFFFRMENWKSKLLFSVCKRDL